MLWGLGVRKVKLEAEGKRKGGGWPGLPELSVVLVPQVNMEPEGQEKTLWAERGEVKGDRPSANDEDQ